MLASYYQTSKSTRPPLRIGLLLDTAIVELWFAEILKHIRESNFARIDLLVFNADEQAKAEQRTRPSLARRLLRILLDERRKAILYRLYERWDVRCTEESEDPFAIVDCSAQFDNIDFLSVVPITKRFVHRFPEGALAQIREKNLDVLIRFGFGILRGDILHAAKYGIWSYHHSDNDYYRGGPAYFWEIYEGNAISGAILQVLNEQLDAGKVLYKGLFPTFPGLSAARNRIAPGWGAMTFLIQKLHELHERGWEHVERNALPPAHYHGRKKIYTVPTNGEMLRWLGPAVMRKAARHLLSSPSASHWRLAVRKRNTKLLDSPSGPDMSGFRWIESPRGRFYADPFLIEEEGKPWVFFEDCDYETERGIISCAEVLADGSLAPPRPALDRPYHLSYPCIFRAEGELYMIPESSTNETIDLYRAVRFPDQWEMERQLFSGRAVDTTVCHEGGLYWFFVTLEERRGFATQLWLFYADSLTGQWTPHQANPIFTDARKNRCAGAIFRHNGKLIRPSQDCTGFYGRSFTLNEVLVLEPERYQEMPMLTVGPWTRDLQGSHTYSQALNFEMVDGCSRLPRRKVFTAS